MTSAIEAITAAKAARVRHSIVVPEWGNVVLYTKPVTVIDYTKINAVHKGFTTDNNIDGLIAMLILKAEDEAGEKAFTAEHTRMLKTEPVTLIATVCRKLFEADLVPDSEEMGNA
jgi:hypothetical protein